jgi:hypothetical protein
VAKSANLERITIYWYAVPNANKSRGGWMPVYDHNGKQRGDTYGKGYDLEIALKMAKASAEDEAAHYVGDWDVAVAQKPESKGTSATKRPLIQHSTGKKYPYIAYWVRTRGGPRSSWDVVPVYVLGTTTRADEGIVGYDLRVRPLRLGKGTYTTVISPDDVEDRP